MIFVSYCQKNKWPLDFRDGINVRVEPRSPTFVTPTYGNSTVFPPMVTRGAYFGDAAELQIVGIINVGIKN